MGIDNRKMKREELVSWLRSKPSYQYTKDKDCDKDGWKKACSENMHVVADALSQLASNNEWHEARWQTAFNIWWQSANNQNVITWESLAPTLNNAPDNFFKTMPLELSRWLRKNTRNSRNHEDILIALCNKIISGEGSGECSSECKVAVAINHSTGIATEVLMNFLEQREKNSKKLTDAYRQIFTELCKKEVSSYKHARVILAKRLSYLFDIDSEWVKENLLPFFNWENPDEACAVWQGYLFSGGNINKSLLECFIEDFLDTAIHIDKLGKCKQNYIDTLSIINDEMPHIANKEKLQQAFNNLPPQE